MLLHWWSPLYKVLHSLAISVIRQICNAETFHWGTILAICILISIWDASVWHVCGLLRCIIEQPVIREIAWCIQARWARFGVEVVNCTLHREADAHLASLSPPPGTQDSSSSPSSGTHDGSFGRLDGTVCALQYVHMMGHLLKLSPTTTVYSPSNGKWKLNSSSRVPW